MSGLPVTGFYLHLELNSTELFSFKINAWLGWIAVRQLPPRLSPLFPKHLGLARCAVMLTRRWVALLSIPIIQERAPKLLSCIPRTQHPWPKMAPNGRSRFSCDFTIYLFTFICIYLFIFFNFFIDFIYTGMLIAWLLLFWPLLLLRFEFFLFTCQVHLTYLEIRQSVLLGYHALTFQQALTLAALQVASSADVIAKLVDWRLFIS